MVQSDISQFSSECAQWLHSLRSYREQIQENKKMLGESCKNSLSKEQLKAVEHYDNQFHIQLINIHDLKKTIKLHEQKIRENHLSDDAYVEHENLLSEYVSQENILNELCSDFKKFIKK